MNTELKQSLNVNSLFLHNVVVLSGFFIPCLLQITSDDRVSVRPGENTTLSCNITDYTEISWYLLTFEEVKLLITAEQGKLDKFFLIRFSVAESYFDIVKSNSSVSLVINGVRDTDLGFYYCGGRNRTHIKFGKPITLSFTGQ